MNGSSIAGNRSQDFLASSRTGNCWTFYCVLNNSSQLKREAAHTDTDTHTRQCAAAAAATAATETVREALSTHLKATRCGNVVVIRAGVVVIVIIIITVFAVIVVVVVVSVYAVQRRDDYGFINETHTTTNINPNNNNKKLNSRKDKIIMNKRRSQVAHQYVKCERFFSYIPKTPFAQSFPSISIHSLFSSFLCHTCCQWYLFNSVWYVFVSRIHKIFYRLFVYSISFGFFFFSFQMNDVVVCSLKY